jgi:hypothetical protein
MGGCGADQAYGGPCFQLGPEGVGSSKTMREREWVYEKKCGTRVEGI